MLETFVQLSSIKTSHLCAYSAYAQCEYGFHHLNQNNNNNKITADEIILQLASVAFQIQLANKNRVYLNGARLLCDC